LHSQRIAQTTYCTANVLHRTYIHTTCCTEPTYTKITAQNLHKHSVLHRTYIQSTHCTERIYIQTTYCTELTYIQRTAQNLHTDIYIYKILWQHTQCTQIITSLHLFNFISIHITSIHCISLHFTQHFSLPCNLVLLSPKHLCQPMDRVCSCVDLTDSNVISASLSVRRSEITRSSVDVQRTCNGVPDLLFSIHNVRQSLCLPFRTEQLIEKYLVNFQTSF
jgi:hypothetical protein